MRETIQRYTRSDIYGSIEFFEPLHPNSVGEFVKAADHERVLSAAEARNKVLEEALEALVEYECLNGEECNNSTHKQARAALREDR